MLPETGSRFSRPSFRSLVSSRAHSIRIGDEEIDVSDITSYTLRSD